MKEHDSMLRIAGNLMAACFIAGLVIGAVYFVTAPVAAQSAAARKEAALRALVPEADRFVEIDRPQAQKARPGAKFAPACDAQGVQLGLITDAAIDEQTLHVTALEISFGPLDDLIGGRRWVHRFTAEAHTGRIVISLPEWERGRPS